VRCELYTWDALETLLAAKKRRRSFAKSAANWSILDRVSSSDMYVLAQRLGGVDPNVVDLGTGSQAQIIRARAPALNRCQIRCVPFQ
jgi:hypothetical protein